MTHKVNQIQPKDEMKCTGYNYVGKQNKQIDGANSINKNLSTNIERHLYFPFSNDLHGTSWIFCIMDRILC